MYKVFTAVLFSTDDKNLPYKFMVSYVECTELVYNKRDTGRIYWFRLSLIKMKNVNSCKSRKFLRSRINLLHLNCTAFVKKMSSQYETFDIKHFFHNSLNNIAYIFILMMFHLVFCSISIRSSRKEKCSFLLFFCFWA